MAHLLGKVYHIHINILVPPMPAVGPLLLGPLLQQHAGLTTLIARLPSWQTLPRAPLDGPHWTQR